MKKENKEMHKSICNDTQLLQLLFYCSKNFSYALIRRSDVAADRLSDDNVLGGLKNKLNVFCVCGASYVRVDLLVRPPVQLLELAL
jgi:hypothetical protein